MCVVIVKKYEVKPIEIESLHYILRKCNQSGRFTYNYLVFIYYGFKNFLFLACMKLFFVLTCQFINSEYLILLITVCQKP